jgi:hypothetical protein
MVFSTALILSTRVFALQIDAPQEIAEQILAYTQEIDVADENVILRVNIAKNKGCNDFILKLIDRRSGKTIEEKEGCYVDLPNSVLQNTVHEIFGHNAKNPVNSSIGGGFKTFLFGVGFAATGILLYYSNPPKPVYGYVKISEEKK